MCYLIHGAFGECDLGETELPNSHTSDKGKQTVIGCSVGRLWDKCRETE